MLPVPGGRTTLQSAALNVNFGEGTRWNGLVVLDRLSAADIEMEDVTLRLGGLAQNLDDPATRNVTVNVEGLATGVWSAEPKVARALGTRIDLFADVGLPAERAGRGQPGPDQRQRPVDLHRRRPSPTAPTPAATPIRVSDVAVFAGHRRPPALGRRWTSRRTAA